MNHLCFTAMIRIQSHVFSATMGRRCHVRSHYLILSLLLLHQSRGTFGNGERLAHVVAYFDNAHVTLLNMQNMFIEDYAGIDHHSLSCMDGEKGFHSFQVDDYVDSPSRVQFRDEKPCMTGHIASNMEQGNMSFRFDSNLLFINHKLKVNNEFMFVDKTKLYYGQEPMPDMKVIRVTGSERPLSFITSRIKWSVAHVIRITANREFEIDFSTSALLTNRFNYPLVIGNLTLISRSFKSSYTGARVRRISSQKPSSSSSSSSLPFHAAERTSDGHQEGNPRRRPLVTEFHHNTNNGLTVPAKGMRLLKLSGSSHALTMYYITAKLENGVKEGYMNPIVDLLTSMNLPGGPLTVDYLHQKISTVTIPNIIKDRKLRLKLNQHDFPNLQYYYHLKHWRLPNKKPIGSLVTISLNIDSFDDTRKKFELNLACRNLTYDGILYSTIPLDIFSNHIRLHGSVEGFTRTNFVAKFYGKCND